MASSFRICVLAVWLVGTTSNAGHAAGCVRFDVSDVIACHDVTTDAFRSMNPTEKLVKAEIEVSAFVGYGQQDDLAQFVYVIEIPEYTGRIVEYAPRTALATDVSGTIQIKEHEEDSTSLGIAASANYQGILSANGNASKNKKSSKSVQFQRLPPQDLVAASGTLSRGSAAFFKIRNSSQRTLEGSQKLTLVIRVDDRWRADYFQIRCAAYSNSPNSKSKNPICGTTIFLAGVHVAGDREARQQAADLIGKERLLRQVAADFNQRIAEPEKDELKSLFDSLLKKKKAPIVPPTWMEQVIRSRAVSRTFPFERHLPMNVREAVSAFTLAKQNLHQLSILSSIDEQPSVRVSHKPDVNPTSGNETTDTTRIREECPVGKWKPSVTTTVSVSESDVAQKSEVQ